MLTCTHLLTKSLIYECYMSYLNASILLAISAIYKSTSQLFFSFHLIQLRTTARLVPSLEQDAEEAWLHLSVLKAMFHEVLLDGGSQPCWGAGA